MPRETCNQCHRPLPVCLCDALVHVRAPCRLIILQHPSEQKQALATVPLLELCIDPVEVWVGEDFNAHDVAKQIQTQPEGVRVVFPDSKSESWNWHHKSAALEAASKVHTLIVIDGTWRKAKKIWLLNPWLHNLKSVTLLNLPESKYQIRSSKMDGGVSTLESVMYACCLLTGDESYLTLSKPFEKMIQLQIQKMGADTFSAHYLK